MSITVGTRVRVVKDDEGYGLVGRTGVIRTDDSGDEIPYQITFDDGTLEDDRHWWYSWEVEEIETPTHLKIEDTGRDYFRVGGVAFNYAHPDAYQRAGEQYLAAAEHIRSKPKPKPVEEPTRDGAEVEVNDPYDHSGRVVVTRIERIGGTTQPWVQFLEGTQEYRVWTWGILQAEDPKVVS